MHLEIYQQRLIHQWVYGKVIRKPEINGTEHEELKSTI